jgi:phosphoribosyl-AMP cyclohydrolase
MAHFFNRRHHILHSKGELSASRVGNIDYIFLQCSFNILTVNIHYRRGVIACHLRNSIT